MVAKQAIKLLKMAIRACQWLWAGNRTFSFCKRMRVRTLFITYKQPRINEANSVLGRRLAIMVSQAWKSGQTMERSMPVTNERSGSNDPLSGKQTTLNSPWLNLVTGGRYLPHRPTTLDSQRALKSPIRQRVGGFIVDFQTRLEIYLRVLMNTLYQGLRP